MGEGEAAALLLRLHGALLRRCCSWAGKHYEGLAMAGRELGNARAIDKVTQKRLQTLDLVAAWIRHVSEPRCKNEVRCLEKQLRGATNNSFVTKGLSKNKEVEVDLKVNIGICKDSIVEEGKICKEVSIGICKDSIFKGMTENAKNLTESERFEEEEEEKERRRRGGGYVDAKIVEEGKINKEECIGFCKDSAKNLDVGVEEVEEARRTRGEERRSGGGVEEELNFVECKGASFEEKMRIGARRRYKKGIRKSSFCGQGFDGNGVFDELEEVDSDEFSKVERAIIKDYLESHGKEFEEARLAELGQDDKLGVKGRRSDFKGSSFFFEVCEQYRGGSRDPADFGKVFGSLMSKGYNEVRKRVGWPCSFAG